MDPILLLLLMLVLLALPLWQTYRQNKQVRQIRDMQAQIEPGDQVQTGAGVHGIVESVGDTTVELTIAQGVTTVWERAAILRNISAENRKAGAAADGAMAPGDDATAARPIREAGTVESDRDVVMHDDDAPREFDDRDGGERA